MQISVIGLLGVAFIVLKLLGYISWPWVWVTSPFWIPFIILICFLAFGIGIAAFIVSMGRK